MAKMQDSMAAPGLRISYVFTSENTLFSDERIVWDSMGVRSDGGMWFRMLAGTVGKRITASLREKK
jgi:hypothetical protein